MKCESCGCDTYVIYIGDGHEKLCGECYYMGDLTNNFSRYEFECKCGCGFDDINLAFIKCLQRIRDKIGFKMPINSGCRCKQHNKDEGGYPTSDHLPDKIDKYSEGADIRVSGSRNRYKLIQAAFEEGIPRIGPGKTFVHLGVNKDNDQEVLWVY